MPTDPKLANTMMGALISTTIKRPGMPAIHAVKTEGPLGNLLESFLPSTGAHASKLDLGNIVDDACCCAHMDLLKKIAGKKYQLILAYIHYGDQLRAMYRDGIYDHFQEHLEEERAQLYQINKKITALGGDAPCDPEPVPCVPLNDARAIFRAVLQIEEASVQLWSELFRKTPDDVALNGMAQTYAQECQGHADDLKRYLRSCE
jgi:bacterioferritin (cytochrome b1)